MTAETLPVVAPETVTPLKPSEAMRLGRLIVPTGCVRVLVRPADLARPAAACALGAMAIGYGVDPHDLLDEHHWWPIRYAAAGVELVDCPVRGACGHDSMYAQVAHLNDLHQWPTEQIATWLEGLGL